MLLACSIGSGRARAAEAPNHPLLFEVFVFHSPGEETLDDPCGVGVDSQGSIYVGDYYADKVVIFNASHAFQAALTGEEPADGPCALAVSASGKLYVNNYHRNVIAFAPTHFPPGGSYGAPTPLDAGNSPTTSPALRPTGVAIDPATGRIYVDDRTYVAVYEPSGAAVEVGGTPLQIGAGSLTDAYGVAVSDYPATNGYLYVPDAKTNTIKVFNPATSTTTPIEEFSGEATPEGSFDDLLDAAVAIDPADGHVFLIHSQGPFYEHPEAFLDELNARGDYRGRVFAHGLLFGAPSGLAVVPPGTPGEGDLYVTSGNAEKGRLFGLGPSGAAHTLEVKKAGTGTGTVTSEPAGIRCGGACVAEFNSGATLTLTATPASGSAFKEWSGACSGTSASCQLAMGEDHEATAEFEPAPSPAASLTTPSSAGEALPLTSIAPLPVARQSGGGRAQASEEVQKEGLLVSTTASMRPTRLPRKGLAPIAVSVAGHISTADGSRPPQLKTMKVKINRHGRLDYQGLPTCKINRIQPASDARALAECRSALVGQGKFFGTITLPGASPYPTEGRLLLFNGQERGHEVLYGHIYATQPFATSFVMVFKISYQRHGTYGTVLSADLAKALGNKRNLTGIEMTLSRRWRSGGKRHSYLSAGCPAPRGFREVVFPLAQTTFSFAGRGSVTQALRSDCKAR